MARAAGVGIVKQASFLSGRVGSHNRLDQTVRSSEGRRASSWERTEELFKTNQYLVGIEQRRRGSIAGNRGKRQPKCDESVYP